MSDPDREEDVLDSEGTDYPALDDYSADVTDVSAFVLGPQRLRVLAQPSPSTPPPARAPRGQKALPSSALSVKLNLHPDKSAYLIQDTVTVTVDVTFRVKDPKNPKKTLTRRYPDKWIQVLFRGKTLKGSGPFLFRLQDTGTATLVVRVRTASGKTESVHKRAIRAICGTVLPADKEVALVARTLFSEGGSKASPPMDDDELIAVVWAIRNRVDALNRHKADKRRFRFLSARFLHTKKFGKSVSYESVITKPMQFTGITTSQFTISGTPEKLNATECQRLAKCIAIAQTVMLKGQPDDPVRARSTSRGNPIEPGVFYYKVKGNSSPTGEAALDPITKADRHNHWGLEEQGPFKPAP